MCFALMDGDWMTALRWAEDLDAWSECAGPAVFPVGSIPGLLEGDDSPESGRAVLRFVLAMCREVTNG